MKPSRNDPCHCGSGRKYKKCHLAQDEAEAQASRPRVVERGDRSFLVSGGLDDKELDLAAQHFREKDAGRGPARQMMDYAAPLLDNADGPDLKSLNKALTMGTYFWNLALAPEDEREREIARMAAGFDEADTEARAAWQAMAQMMIARHQQMFPEMHVRKRS